MCWNAVFYFIDDKTAVYGCLLVSKQLFVGIGMVFKQLFIGKKDL